MSKMVIKSEKLRTLPIPYSMGFKAGNFVFLSSISAMNEKGELVGKDDAKIQAKQAFEKIKIALESVGAKVSDIIKLTTFLKKIGDYSKFVEARAEFFKENSIDRDFPASTVVQATLPWEDFLIEIEAIAYIE